ncbi:MAG: HPr family phosphocarrier protein [Deltaproteobacteria bacterium]|nr:MAG: HPr family phosphocarrier protein [Deltaproteobacteria bacterium]
MIFSKEAFLPTLEKTFTISNELGLHARPAAQFVKIASHYQSNILVHKEDREVNGKSIMGILMLAAPKGTEIKITAEGPDAEEAVKELGELINNKFGER